MRGRDVVTTFGWWVRDAARALDRFGCRLVGVDPDALTMGDLALVRDLTGVKVSDLSERVDLSAYRKAI